MLKQLQKNRNQKGFTIIEVLIVLAIAGLILLIVFLAVPALQRNSRNTQRKNDVASLLAAVAEVSNNNNGKQAATCSGSTPMTFDTNPAGASAEAKVAFYNVSCAVGAAGGSGKVGVLAAFAATGPYTTAAQDMVTLVPSATCSSTNAAVAGAARQWVAVYEIEKGAGTYAAACQES